MDSPLREMPLLPITSPETITACKDLSVTKDDVFICSYPKSGTTWTQNLVCRLLAANIGIEFNDDWHLSMTAPFYEVDQYWEGKNRIPEKVPLRNTEKYHRVFNTHLRPHQLPPNARCVYVVRNALDVLASFYHHLTNQSEADGGYVGSPEQFCSDFVAGTILYGRWQDSIEAWLGKGNTNIENVLILHYEDMKVDLEQATIKLARFLGIPETSTNHVVEIAIPKCTFSAMRAERHRYTPLSVEWKKDEEGKPYQNFVRSGRIGDGQKFLETYFTEDLKKQWIADLVIARARWCTGGVGSKVIEKYLGMASIK
jgi:hypothetical protein